MLGAAGLVAILASATCVIWVVGNSHRPSETDSAVQFVRLELHSELSTTQVAQALQKAELLSDESSFSWYKRTFHPLARFESGPHWLPRSASHRQYVQLLARLRGRAIQRVNFPEGWDSFQIAERLEQRGICEASEFLRLALAERELDADGGQSHEGFLYPASYDFRSNTAPSVVLDRLYSEGRRRIDQVFTEQDAKLQELRRDYDLDADAVVTLASMVQKEAADRSEFGTIASVFLNRLGDENFRPRRMLQSDPTAGYGCKLPGAPLSCAGFDGRIQPAMLRDSQNPYNTYRHPGVPPGPIGNPSVEAIVAVLNPPSTTYLFFVATDGGRHTFSQTLEAHRAAIRGTVTKGAATKSSK